MEKNLHITDVTNASRTLLMNLKTLQWDDSLLKFFELKPSVLPKIVSSSEVYGELAGGALKGVKITGIAGDQQAALIGNKCLKQGEAKCTYGTGAFLLFCTGDEVVLTGSMSRTREAWERDVRAAGLSPWPYVTRRTRLLVAADPDSLSTKARTARRYGVPVVTEAAFARLLAAHEGASGRTPEPGVRRWAS